MSRRLIVHLLLCLGLVGLYATSYNALLHHRTLAGQTDRPSSGLWELPPVMLHVLAGEFKGLMADYLVLEAGAQLGTELVRTPDGRYRVVARPHDWQTIHRLFMASQSLDPAFQHTYMLAEGWLPWDAKMVAETQVILQTAATHRPWDWRPTHFQGFNTYYFLNQPGAAGKLFLEAAKVPNAPPFLPILGARLAQKGGETKTAIILMKSMLVDKPESDPGYADILDRLHALEGVLVLEEAVARYRATTGKLPADLADLVSSGVLRAFPENPYHLSYCLDQQGVIYFDNPNCRSAATR